jgi:hypothetical protein
MDAKSVRSQKAFLAFVILFGALQTAFYNVDANPWNLIQIVLAPRIGATCCTCEKL